MMIVARQNELCKCCNGSKSTDEFSDKVAHGETRFPDELHRNIAEYNSYPLVQINACCIDNMIYTKWIIYHYTQ